MIKVTHLNGEGFFINCDQIEFVESESGTIISFVSGRKLRVIEPADKIVEMVLAYRRSIYSSVPELITSQK